MEPATATALMVATSVMGAGMSAAGQVASGVSQQNQAAYNKQLADYNAALARRQAAMARSAGQMAATEREAEGQRLLSRQQVAFDAAGVDSASGSPLTVMAETAANIERDVLNTKYNYEIKALQGESQADIWTMKGEQEMGKGSQAAWGGLLGGAMAAFQGAANVFSAYSGSPLTKKAGVNISG